MKAVTLIAVTLSVFTAAVAAGQEQQARADTTSMPPGASPTTIVASPQPDSTYVIGVEDVVHISVWEEPQLTTTQAVRTDGKISLPLLNDVQAAGLTPMQLAAKLTDQLKRLVDDPRVTVAISRMKPERIYMVGEVLHAGPISLTPKMTILEALVTVGFTPFANRKKVYILRTVNGTKEKLHVNYKRLIKGDSSNQDIPLIPGDVIVVP